MREKTEVAVIGGGPGGLVATLYLLRYRRDVTLFQYGDPRASWIPRIRNLVAQPEGLSGIALLSLLREQVGALGPKVVSAEARVLRTGRGFRILAGEREFYAKKVILATGMEDKQPDLPNLSELRQKALLGYCPICDGFEHADSPVGLFVKDRAGLAKIPFLARFSRELHVVLVGDVPLGPKARRDLKAANAKVYRGLKEALPIAGGRKLRLQFSRRHVDVRMAYVEMGVRIKDSAFSQLQNLRRTKEGFLLVSYHQETSIPGLFAVGDCVNALAQVSVAVGHAAIAATRVHNELGAFTRALPSSQRRPTRPCLR